MGKQTSKCAVIFVLIIGVFGCATYPPPIILPDKATNFKYQYSVDIPSGWEVYEKFPPDMADSFPYSFKRMVTLVMIHKPSKGIIAIANEKKRSDFKEVLGLPDSKWHQIEQDMKKSMSKDGNLFRYNSKIKIDNLAATYANWRENRSSFKSKAIYEIETDLKYSMHDSKVDFCMYLYPCHNKSFCMTAVLLGSEIERYDQNRPVFEAVAESLTMHDLPAD